MKKTARKSQRGEAVNVQPTTTRVVQLQVPTPEALRDQLFGVVVNAGLAAVAAMFEADRVKLCGPRYVHDSCRSATRAGYADGELAMGGRRVAMKRPRVRDRNNQEVVLPTWDALSGDEALTERAVEQMILGVTTRKYARSLETPSEQVSCRGTSRSAVSRRFVAATEVQLDAMLTRPLDALNIVAVMIDGIGIEEHTVLIALGIDTAGQKHVLGLHEGATENEAAAMGLVTSLRERGLPTDRSTLFVIDGAKALAKAIRSVFGARGVIQRCMIHKMRNVAEHLPKSRAPHVLRTMRTAYASGDAAKAKNLLSGLARQLQVPHPSASKSLLEGLDETLTVIELGLTDALLRTLSSTNAIENLNGMIRVRTDRVRKWRGGTMVLRWVTAAVDDASQGFRRLRGHKQMPKLIAALRARDITIAPIKKVA